MVKVTGLSAAILSILVISSCASERIQISRKTNQECKLPDIRNYHSRNTQVLALRPDGRPPVHLKARPGNKSGSGRSAIKFSTRKHSGLPDRSVTMLKDSKNEQLVLNQLPEIIQIEPAYLKPAGPSIPAENLTGSDDKISISGNKIDNEIKTARTTDRFTGAPVQEKAETENPSFETEASLPAAKPEAGDKTPFRKTEILILVMAMLAGLVPMTVIRTNPKLAEDVSFWAAMNPWKTRIMFGVLQVALVAAGFMAGEKLADNGVHLSNLSRDLMLGVFLSSSLLYPSRNSGIKLVRYTPLRQRAFNLALAISGFMLMTVAGNDQNIRESFARKAGLNPAETGSANIAPNRAPATKQLLYYQDLSQSQDDKLDSRIKKGEKGSKILQTVFAAFLVILIGGLIAAGACALACNGMPGLAYATAIGGGILLIVFATWLIRGIWGKRSPKLMKT